MIWVFPLIGFFLILGILINISRVRKHTRGAPLLWPLGILILASLGIVVSLTEIFLSVNWNTAFFGVVAFIWAFIGFCFVIFRID